MSRIKNIIMDAVALNKLENRGVDDLIRYLEEDHTIRYQIYRELEYMYRREDVLNAVEEYNDENDTEISFEEDEIANIVERYEDFLEDMGDWRWCLNNAITPWIEEKINE